MNTKKQFKYFDIIMSVFVTILVVSNIASSAKIVDWGINLFGIDKLRLAFDAGTLLFPISYIFGDVLIEVYGYQRSRKVIWTGFGCLGLSALVFWIIKLLPGETTWQTYAGDAAFLAILGGMSSGGIVLASLAGYWSGEFSNSFTLAKMKIWTGGKFLWMRTIGSTIVGEFVDTIIFMVIASSLGVFPWSLFWSLSITNYIFKVGIEALMTPVTYLVVGKLKKAENEDYYDRGTDFNPFKL
jgi:uncharacterized integral membrane protein (TIGR00697 family)